MQPPEKRNPAAASGRVNRKVHALDGAEPKIYATTESVSSLAVYLGREFLGSILETPDGHQAADATGAVLGNFPTCIAAARAFSEVAQT
ncbi:MAG: hypothetical protein JWR80_3113 [Bradyrhizobium sp.]|nr:hypothetical protein [Bradyrhizobium sp.]